MRRMLRIIHWVGPIVLLQSCVSELPAPVYGTPATPDRAFDELVVRNPYGISPDVDVLALPEAAQQLLDRTVKGKHTKRLRVEAVGTMFIDGGALGMQYETMSTGTAAETFEHREGNCLAYTHLFIAMARRAGVDARYREVLGVPQWETSGEFVMLNHHIAAYGEFGRGGTYVVDFGFLSRGERAFGRVISDDRARAQHFNNLGAQALVNGNVAAAVRLFARGLTIDPSVGYLWTNLGTAYLRDGDPTRAEMALHQALNLTIWDVTALNQLTRLYDVTGRDDLAETYRRRSEVARRQNPYLQFAWGIEARDAGNLDAAVDYLRHATHTEPDELYFWLELAKTYVMQGKPKDAQRTLYRAETMVTTEEQDTAFKAAITDLTKLMGGEREKPGRSH